jgi:TPR repeat protein
MGQRDHCVEEVFHRGAGLSALVKRGGLMLVVGVVLLLGAKVCRADVMRDLQDCQDQQSDQRSGFGAKQIKQNPQYCAGLLAYKQKDFVAAVAALRIATDQGSAGAAGLLGYMYQTGRGVQADPQRAFSYFMQAAKMGNGDAMHEVARSYQNGTGVAKNQAEADRWFREAEAHGTEKGPVSTGPAHLPDMADLNAGATQYEAKNFTGAMPYLRRAAEAGNVRAIVQVGLMYERGEGVTKGAAEAVRWYAKGAALGDATAEKDLGYMYENAQGVAENWPMAAELYQKSAAQAFAEGEFALGRAYEFGIGIEQDRAKAILWFSRAGAQGVSKGEYFAKWLSEPTNFIGFRDQAESDAVMGGKMRFAGDFLGGDPTGRLFRSSAERNAFMVAFSKSADFHEASAHWGMQHNDYLACQGQGGGSSCHNPGPPPAVPR